MYEGTINVRWEVTNFYIIISTWSKVKNNEAKSWIWKLRIFETACQSIISVHMRLIYLVIIIRTHLLDDIHSVSK